MIQFRQAPNNPSKGSLSTLSFTADMNADIALKLLEQLFLCYN
jgi:hypothetical protein